ncbi:LIM homeobox transcription factor 1-beta-like isoform X3 [Symsagittifera roscoffensis]
MTVIMSEDISIWSDKHQQNHSIIGSQSLSELSSDFVPPKNNLAMNKIPTASNSANSFQPTNPCYPLSRSFPHIGFPSNPLGSLGPIKSLDSSASSSMKENQSFHQNMPRNHAIINRQNQSISAKNNNNNNNSINQNELPCHLEPQGSSGVAFCEGCGLAIEDRFMLQTTDRQCWHEKCLNCAACGCKLDHTCFIRNSQPYCRKDYESLVSGNCTGCELKIASTEMVMRVADNIYHLNCFSCSVCRIVLRTGDQFVQIEEQLYCKTDFEKQFPQFAMPEKQSSSENDNSRKLFDSIAENEGNSCSNQNSDASDPNLMDHLFKSEHSNHEHESDQIKTETNSDNELDSEPKDDSDDEADLENSKDKNSSIQQKPCRKRVILTTQQRRAFKAAFDLSSKPCRKVREQLARDTGLSVRVVQVWFQNERAKVKKLAKRQQQQQHTHLESGLGSPHLMDDGQFSVFIPNEAGFLPPQLDGRFSSHLAQSNHIIHPEGGLYSLPPGLNDMYPVCSGPPMGGGGQIPNESEFINATSDFPQILDMKESEIYNSMKLANQISHPVDKLYSMQNSYFTS